MAHGRRVHVHAGACLGAGCPRHGLAGDQPRAHAARHGCTLDDAKGYVRAAKCTVRRKRWDGVSINCYSLDGAAYIDADTMKVKTAFSEKDFDPTTKAIAEVFR